jgi:mono/diheme cytochrome c family protein
MKRTDRLTRHARWLAALLPVAILTACSGYDGGPQGEIAAKPSPAPQVEPDSIDLVRGEALYQDLCAHCHGPEAQGGRGWPSLRDASCQSCGEYTDLWQTIEATMPWRAANQCGRRCARDIAAWIVNDLSTTPTCTVGFEYTQIGMQDFRATVRIANRRGLDVETWTLAWTPDAGQRITAVDGGEIESRATDLLLMPAAGNAHIADGDEVRITLEGTHEGMNAAPDDLRLEAPPCFAAAPAAG